MKLNAITQQKNPDCYKHDTIWSEAHKKKQKCYNAINLSEYSGILGYEHLGLQVIWDMSNLNFTWVTSYFQVHHHYLAQGHPPSYTLTSYSFSFFLPNEIFVQLNGWISFLWPLAQSKWHNAMTCLTQIQHIMKRSMKQMSLDAYFVKHLADKKTSYYDKCYFLQWMLRTHTIFTHWKYFFN